jgi:hypothetical protein
MKSGSERRGEEIKRRGKGKGGKLCGVKVFFSAVAHGSAHTVMRKVRRTGREILLVCGTVLVVGERGGARGQVAAKELSGFWKACEPHFLGHWKAKCGYI